MKTTYSADICQYFLKVVYDWNVNKRSFAKNFSEVHFYRVIGSGTQN